MEVIYERKNRDYNYKKPSGIGLGNFDGLHKGHRKLIDTLVKTCDNRNLTSWIYTFETHPSNVLESDNPVSLIITNKKKTDVLETTGVDKLYFGCFDKKFADITADKFIEEILVKKFNANLIVTGFNYFFGKGGKGDTELLKKAGEHFGFDVIIIPPVIVNDQIVSSTACRNLIAKGDIPGVNKMLGRKYSMNGIVKRGRKLGTDMGMPTANILPDDKYLLPQKGVYVTNTYYKGKKYRSVTNIGVKPTISSDEPVTIETHLLDFNNAIMYDNEIKIEYLCKIRDEMKFENYDKLVKQIKKDIRYALKFKECKIKR